MTAATTFAALLAVAGICVGSKTDRSGLVILSALLLAALAIITFILVGLGNMSNTAVSALWTFASIIASFCIPMTLAYYVTNATNAGSNITQLLTYWSSSLWPGLARNAVAER